MGLPHSLSSAALCGKSNKLQLPFSSLNKEFKISCIREALVCQDSKVSRVTSAGIMVRTGRKLRAQESLKIAESHLRHRALVGTVATGQAGSGAKSQPHYDILHGRDCHQLG